MLGVKVITPIPSHAEQPKLVFFSCVTKASTYHNVFLLAQYRKVYCFNSVYEVSPLSTQPL